MSIERHPANRFDQSVALESLSLMDIAKVSLQLPTSLVFLAGCAGIS